ncbi:hypothetical protein [Paragemmobacter ruber]|uniref:Head-tail adaptor protein n=1 Tax=Paragemmobacter ruber TaxID=1985673 RepID=A0ABW9Y0C1_9RHOB|nr:hypothetical protein [Rhodobacter ruber]NBE05933.1 hypothetical protein [Rhodobacter ruber]
MATVGGVKLDRLIEVWRPSVEDDGFQSRPGAPVLLGKAWAAQQSAGSAEVEGMGQDAVAQTCRFILRQSGVGGQIGAADVIRLGGVEWIVAGILPESPMRTVTVLARAKVAA